MKRHYKYFALLRLFYKKNKKTNNLNYKEFFSKNSIRCSKKVNGNYKVSRKKHNMPKLKCKNMKKMLIQLRVYQKIGKLRIF